MPAGHKGEESRFQGYGLGGVGRRSIISPQTVVRAKQAAGLRCSSEERQGAQSEQKNPVQESSHSLNFSLLFFFQNLQDEHQQAAPGNTAAGEHVSDVRAAELQGKLQHSEAANKVFLHEEHIQC